MLDQHLLDILVCPETQQRLHLADDALVDRLNRAIDAGTLLNRKGEKVARNMVAGLIREDAAVLYPIIDDIPVLLVDESIALK